MSTPSPLLSPLEPPAFEEWWPESIAHPALLTCDHASSRVPMLLGNLGLSLADLDGHIAVDIGAAALTRKLAALMQVTAISTIRQHFPKSATGWSYPAIAASPANNETPGLLRCTSPIMLL